MNKSPATPRLWTAHALGGGFVLAFTLTAWFLLLHPMLHARDAYAALVTQLETQRQNLDAQHFQERSGERIARTAADSLAAHPLQLQPPAAVNSRLQALSELAALHDFRIDTIEAGRPEPFPLYAVIPISLSGRCRFADLHAFLADLRRTMPDIDIAAADCSGRYSDDSPGQGLVMKLRWHTAVASRPEAAR